MHCIEETYTLITDVRGYRTKVQHDDGKEFYNIMYEHTHIEKDERIKCLHIEDIKNPNPFFDTPMIEHFGGDIIVKNELTEVLIKFLTMADEELSKKSGKKIHDRTSDKTWALASMANDCNT